GHSFNFSAGLTMAPRSGFYGSLFYSHTTSNTTTDNQGSNASSAWGATASINNPNDIFLASQVDALPHRVVGAISYRKEYLKHLATTVSLYYSGSSQGRYSFTYSADVNGDGIGNDLLYVPNNASELNFAPFTSGGVTFTAADQAAAFNKLISNSKYLDKTRGSIADRNGALMPWYNRIDMKFLQDIFVNVGKAKNTVQLSLDIVNLANMINSDWGIRKQLITNASTPLRVATGGGGTTPTFNMNTVNINGQTVLPTEMYQDVRTFGTTWSMQVGIRYLFN
ncbi:MAG TPA: hypothetical protein PKC69_02560, partial [Chitinophagaceae bacterium]|nr:hypothetical protein [Chitinophagaceae bacterium]